MEKQELASAIAELHQLAEEGDLVITQVKTAIARLEHLTVSDESEEPSNIGILEARIAQLEKEVATQSRQITLLIRLANERLKPPSDKR